MIEFDYATLEHRLRELAFLNSGARIVLRDARHADVKREEMRYEGGMAAFVRYLDRSKAGAVRRADHAARRARTASAVEVALWWNDSYHEHVLCFTNNIPQRDGGTHLAGFRGALTRVINKYADETRHRQEGEGGADGRRCARRAHLRSVREGARSQVLQPDQGQARLLRGEAGRREHRRRSACRLVRGASRRKAKIIVGKVVEAARRARGCAQGARADAAQGRARHQLAAGQARRMPGPRPGQHRDVHRRGRLGRRLRQAGPQPRVPGRAADSRQDPERRARALRQDAVEQEIGTLITALGTGIGRDDFKLDEAALPQDHHHDGRRRRRRPHPHAAADVLLSPDARAGGEGPPLHRPAAALQGRARARRRPT